MPEPPDHVPVRSQWLGDPALLSDLRRFIAARVPRAEAEDVLQTTLTSALESDSAPSEKEEFRRWVHGVARHKVADHFRRLGREPQLLDDPPDLPAPDSAQGDAKELLRWVERELPPGEQSEDTLDWMLREGAGEKLETIAREENLPAPRVRQRVSRLRRYFRTRWAAAAAVLSVALVLAFWLAETREPLATAPPKLQAEPPRVEELRKGAAEACGAQQWRRCLVLYDEAKLLDDAGDQAPAVQADRKRAHDAISKQTPLPTPLNTQSPVPQDSAEPSPAPEAPAPSSEAPEPKAPPTKAPPTKTAPPLDQGTKQKQTPKKTQPSDFLGSDPKGK